MQGLQKVKLTAVGVPAVLVLELGVVAATCCAIAYLTHQIVLNQRKINDRLATMEHQVLVPGARSRDYSHAERG
jgi:hypothetical protein